MSLTRRSGVRIPLFLAVLVSTLCLPLAAQTAPGSAAAALQPIPQANRVPAQANFTQQTQLAGHLPGWVTADRQTAAAVDLSAPMHISIVLRRDPTVQVAFEKLLANQQNPASSLYHHWLTPQQIGDLYGPTSSDVAAVTGWLASQGLSVLSVSPSRISVTVSGSAASVANAFRTSFAYYNLAGKARLSATSEPTIPTALTPVIASIGGLTEMPVEPQSHRTPAYRPVSPGGGAIEPQPELTTTNGDHYLTPKDFAVIYDVNPVYTAGNTGATIGSTAQHVAIVGRSRVAASDISTYATNTGIGSYTLNTIVPTAVGGIDPGITNTSDQDEATLDVDRVIGTAPGAIVDLLVSSDAGGGIDAGLDYNVNNLLDPIMSVSFGSCEASSSSANEIQNDAFFQQAAAEGISVFVSSDDSGVAGCETSFANPTAGQTASINSLCSSGYVTCVGGTEFNDTANPATYWASTNSAGFLSALSYIPEGAWNEPTSSTNSSGFQVAASGGGPSIYISKPTWQTGTGVPADAQRDTPDVAFPAADHDGYYACLDYALPAGESCAAGYFFDFSGTSAAAPSMAGIAALLNTKLGTAQGNVNPLLYKLATSNPSAFHDVTVTTSGVTGCTTATPSMCNNSTPGPTALTGGVAGYAVTAGYDLATGLGSLDVSNFLTAAAQPVVTFTVTPATTAITLAAGATTGNTDTITLASQDTFAGTVALTCAVTNSSGTAVGTCSLAPTSATLTSGGTGTSVLTINTTAGANGVLNVIVTGTSGTTVVNASTIVVTATAPTFTITPATTAISLASGATTGNTDSIALASVNNFAGTVALTCSAINATGTATGTCSLAPASTPLTSGGSGTSVLTINTTAGTSGSLVVTVFGASGSLVAANSLPIVVTVTAPLTPSFTLTPAATTMTLAPGATTGNTDAITLASTNGFVGSVALTCSITPATGIPPTCAVSPTSVTLAANGTGTSTVTINTQGSSSGCSTASLSYRGPVGMMLAGILLLVLPIRKRKAIRALTMVFMLAGGLTLMTGCGGSSGGTSCSNPASTTAGTYTVTITGASGSTSVPVTFTLTIS
jgi:pseudomonalisin